MASKPRRKKPNRLGSGFAYSSRGPAAGYSQPRARPKAPPRTVAPTYQPPVAPPPSAAPLNQGLATAANAGLSGGTGGYDVNSDPAVAAAHGLAAKMRATAQAQALAKRSQAAIEYGDPSGVEGISDVSKKAASENPFSILKNLEHGYSTGVNDLEEGLNNANLFYSGYRGKQLGEAARGYQDSRYQAGTRFKALNTDINDNLANALLNADAYEASSIMGSDGGGYGYDDGASGTSGYDPNRSLAGAGLGLVGGLSGTGRIRGTPTRRRSRYPSSYVNIRQTRGY